MSCCLHDGGHDAEPHGMGEKVSWVETGREVEKASCMESRSVEALMEYTI